MNRRNVFQFAAAAVVTPAAVLAAPVPETPFGPMWDTEANEMIVPRSRCWGPNDFDTVFESVHIGVST